MKILMRVGLVFLASFMVLVAQAGILDANTDVNVSAYADAEQLQKEAAKYKLAKWKIPLNQDVIENMLVLDGERAVLSLRNYNRDLKRDRIIVVDLAKGRMLWSRSAAEDENDISIVAVSKKYILIKSNSKNTTRLTALKIRSGQPVWKKELTTTGWVMVQQLDKNHVILATANNSNVEYQYIKISSGKKQWSYRSAKRSNPLTNVIAYKKGIIIPADQLISLSRLDGRVLWKFKAIKYPANTAAPILSSGSLYIVDSENALNKINLSKGKLIWRHKNPRQYRLTAIDVSKTQVYLRGLEDTGARPTSVFIKIDRQRGRLKWRTSIKDKLSLVSNLLEYKGYIYVASPTTLYAFRKKTGKIKFSQVVSRSQLSLYPVTLRRVDKNIVFAGELTIAAFYATTGKKIYRRALTGISPAADLSALETSIKRLQKKNTEKENQTGEIWRCVSCLMSVNAQARANELYSKSWTRGLTDYEAIEGGMARKMSKVYAAIGVYETAVSLSELIYTGLISKMDKENLARHKLIHTTIINAYPAMMTPNYIYRPTRSMNLIDPDAGEFMQITAINLRNGKKSKTSTSVPYKDYGLWIYVDEKKQIAYQQSIGFSPNEDKPLMSYLIAKPVVLPR